MISTSSSNLGAAFRRATKQFRHIAVHNAHCRRSPPGGDNPRRTQVHERLLPSTITSQDTPHYRRLCLSILHVASQLWLMTCAPCFLRPLQIPLGRRQIPNCSPRNAAQLLTPSPISTLDDPKRLPLSLRGDALFFTRVRSIASKRT